jgi:hypothetical protein
VFRLTLCRRLLSLRAQQIASEIKKIREIKKARREKESFVLLVSLMMTLFMVIEIVRSLLK